ncbi:MAG: tRNA pseudouridine(55) synthase TruB [Flavobacteriaceae bacterium]|nr:tRNA pseudouridine(55) synthase TruB [Flavobacteriaceae bacterium]
MFSLDELKEGKVFIIDKPLDWTSFDVVNKIRWNIRKTFKIKKFKVGHAGTLDPKATGVLVICVGNFTKKINEFMTEDKLYSGTLKLGATTESYDTEQPENAFFPINHITEEMILETAQKFEGPIQQLPPIHSAVKKDGKKLYQLARAGVEVEIQPRPVFIHYFKIIQIEFPVVHFQVKCSKGTYIRSLAHDFGLALDSGAYLTALRRLQSGDFHVEMADNSIFEPEFFGNFEE